MNLQTLSSKKRAMTTTGWSAVPSALWQHLGLPEDERRDWEWVNPAPADAVILRALYRICRFGNWPKSVMSYLLNPQDGTLTPRVLVRMPAVKAMIRLRAKWPFAYEQLNDVACRLAALDNEQLYHLHGGCFFNPGDTYHLQLVKGQRERLFCHLERLLQQYAAFACRRADLEACKTGSSSIPSTFSGWSTTARLDQLIDHVDEMERTWDKANAPRGQYRRLDKIARKMDHKSLKREYREDYDLGKALAPYYGTILEHLEEKAQEHNVPIFVHGRDGEIVYMLLKDRGIPAAYAVTSRSLTTSCYDMSNEDREKVKAYFYRVVPQRAWHYDTGFVGSIPHWFKEKGWDVVGISLASSDNREYQIPGLEDLNKGTSYKELKHKTLRDVVLDYMEHQPQRFEKAHKLAFEYSSDCPKFWARLAGVRSGLKKWERRFSTSGEFQVKLGDLFKDLADDNDPIYDFAAKWQGSHSHAIQRAERLSWGVWRWHWYHGVAGTVQMMDNLRVRVTYSPQLACIVVDAICNGTIIGTWTISHNGTHVYMMFDAQGNHGPLIHLDACPTDDPLKIPF